MKQRDELVERHIAELDATVGRHLSDMGIGSLSMLGFDHEYNAIMSKLRAAMRDLYEQGWKTGVAEREKVSARLVAITKDPVAN